MQRAIFWVMPFTATGTLQIAGPGRSLTIVVFGNHKRGPATAGDEIHLEPLFVGLGHVRVEYTIRRQHIVILSGIPAFVYERVDGVEGPLHVHGRWPGGRDCKYHELRRPWNR